MKILATFDARDYEGTTGIYEKYSIRAIIVRDGRLAMQCSQEGEYKIPGGGQEPGENYEQTLIREVKEETGLDASQAEGGYLFTYKRENPGEGDNYFVDVYRFVMDVEDKDLKLQTEETDGYMFATLDQIKAFAAEGKFLHYDSIKKAFEF